MKDILKDIDTYEDFKSLNEEDLSFLCENIKDLILYKTSVYGGHVASNLGDIELIVALEYVFDLNKDKLVFDVSHQTYTHKILTGRKNMFLDLKTYTNTASFTNINESKYDLFTLGHTSSSISIANGLALARNIKKEKYNVISLIGDGSFSGGEAFEGLNNVGKLKSNFIIILNDNDMSIANNSGALYKSLSYLKKHNGRGNHNIFKDFGFDYKYIEDGNNVNVLIEELSKIKDYKKPIVVHVHTEKGHGYSYALNNKEAWHYRFPFDINSGELKKYVGKTYETINREYFSNMLDTLDNVVLITAGTPKNFGFTSVERNKYKNRFIDVGIAEQTALSTALGISKNGLKPIVNISSNFLQRGFDQIAHEISLNKPNMILIVGYSGYQKASSTHQNVFDIPYISNIPNINYYSPCYLSEYISILQYAINNKGTFIIRQPYGVALENEIIVTKDIDSYSYLIKEKDIALIGVGLMKEKSKEIHNILKEKDISSSLINVLNISSLDTKFIDELIKTHKIIVTIEDGIKEGGYGYKVSSYLSSSNVKVLNYGLKKVYYDFIDLNEAFKDSKMDNETIVNDILKLL